MNKNLKKLSAIFTKESGIAFNFDYCNWPSW